MKKGRNNSRTTPTTRQRDKATAPARGGGKSDTLSGLEKQYKKAGPATDRLRANSNIAKPGSEARSSAFTYSAFNFGPQPRTNPQMKMDTGKLSTGGARATRGYESAVPRPPHDPKPPRRRK